MYKKIAPAYLEDVQEIHKTEPYIYSQMIAGKEALRHGEAKNSWLTGTAAWNFVAISQYILGIHPDFDGLRLKPVLPDHLDNITVTRKYRENTYEINIIKDSNNKGVFMNNKRLESDLVTYLESDEVQKVLVRI